MLEIKLRKIEEIQPSAINPKIITEKDLGILIESIKTNPQFFEARPILLSDRTGDLLIIAGHQRYKAAQKLGLKEVPTILIEGLTLQQEKEIMLRDNINNGTFDVKALEKEFSEISFKRIGLNVQNIKIQKKYESGNGEGEYKEEDLMPFTKTHILISVPVDLFIEVAPLLEKIKAIKGIDYEQSSN